VWFLVLIQLALSYHMPICSNRLNGYVRSRKYLGSISAEVDGLHSHRSERPFTATGKLAVKVKLPIQDRSMVERFLRESEHLVEGVWDKAKIKKSAPERYLVQLSVIPVPGLNIVSPELEVELSNHKGTLYVNGETCLLRDGCGRLLTDPALASLQVTLSGKLRISNSNEDSGEAGEEAESHPFIPKKRPIGGPSVYVEGSAEYSISGQPPATLQQNAQVFDQVATLLQDRFDDFMRNRLPLRLTKTFKAYAANVVKNREFW